VPLITVLGRKGGSGLAAAAVNALAELAVRDSANQHPMLQYPTPRETAP